MNCTEIIDDFEKKAGVRLKERDKSLYYDGDLDLSNTKITSLPDNLTVGGHLDLSETPITSLPENLTVGGALYLRNTPITSLPDNIIVGGSIFLRRSRITSLPDNLTVGRGLYLDFTSITSLPDNLTIGGNLHLYGTNIASLPDSLTVCRHIYADWLSSIDTNNVTHVPPILEWKRGDKKYCKVDELFTEVISEHGNVKKVRFINEDECSYLVTDGEGNWSHGDTLKEAKRDLIYKVSNRTKSQYTSFTLDSQLTFEEAIVCYRVITGACSVGTREFVTNRLTEKAERYTISEIINVTKGEYGHDTFKDFFNNKIASTLK